MLTGKRAAIAGLLIGLAMFQIVLAWGQTQPPVQPEKAVQKSDDLPALLKARAEAAKKTYEGAAETLIQTTPKGNLVVREPDEVYRWSVRWYHAQRDLSNRKEEHIAAAAAHLERMGKLKKAVEMGQFCLFLRWQQDAAEYYRVEAEIWLAQEKSR